MMQKRKKSICRIISKRSCQELKKLYKEQLRKVCIIILTGSKKTHLKNLGDRVVALNEIRGWFAHLFRNLMLEVRNGWKRAGFRFLKKILWFLTSDAGGL